MHMQTEKRKNRTESLEIELNFIWEYMIWNYNLIKAVSQTTEEIKGHSTKQQDKPPGEK